MERAVLDRFNTVPGPRSLDPEYVHDLCAAVSAAVSFGPSIVDLGERRAPQIPLALFGQARVATCCGVSLDSMLGPTHAL
jgi:hypothetical protein